MRDLFRSKTESENVVDLCIKESENGMLVLYTSDGKKVGGVRSLTAKTSHDDVVEASVVFLPVSPVGVKDGD